MPEAGSSPGPAVADATVLIYLGKLTRLDDLWESFPPVLVPEPIHQEVVREGKRLEHPDSIRVEAALEENSLVLAGPTAIPDGLEDLGLAYGDKAVLAVALAREAGTVLTDDHGVRTVARGLGLDTRGTLAFLIQALEDEEISFAAYLEELEKLTELGFRLSAEFYAHVVRRGREIVGNGEHRRPWR